ncbi:MAG TPA: S8 family serine peptidase [Candidatus Dormibacteraeota bacterium]|nr:S8 family serine peptidase [Candidatus Dormibacteraeota bacterium]
MPRRRVWGALLAGALGIASTVALVPAQAAVPATLDPTLAATVAASGPTTLVQMVGELTHTPTALDIAALQATGARAIAYTALPMVALQAQAGQVAALQTAGPLTAIYQNRGVELTLHESVPFIGADVVQHSLGFNGRGVGIAILDSGIDGNHPDLAYPTHVIQNVQMAGGSDAFAQGVNAPGLTVPGVIDTDTSSGHGTHVAGIAAGDGTASAGYYTGVAPGADLIGLGAGQAEDMISTVAGLDWIVSNHSQYHIRVVNCSWGDGKVTFDPSDPINLATKAVHDAGVAVVMAAGNDGTSTDPNPLSTTRMMTYNRYAWPAWVIGVAGGDKLGQRASYSSVGDATYHPTVTAPGSFIASARAVTGVVTDANSTPFDLTDPANPRVVAPNLTQYYTIAEGTSMATPHVTGVVALMLQANPALTPDQVKAILAGTATPMPTCPVTDCGAGYLNALAAVKGAIAAIRKPPTASLVANPVTGGSPLSVSFDASASVDPSPQGSVVGYRWDFNGDGVVDLVTTTPYTAHVYTTGAYTASVVAVDDVGLASSPATAQIVSDNPPRAGADVPRNARPGDSVAFDGTESQGRSSAVVAWAWDFGDGTTGAGATTTHAYTGPAGEKSKLYRWRLTVTDALGRTGSTSGTIKVGDGN